MSLLFLIFLPKIIAAKWDIVTSKSPTLEAINVSHVYVDYSEAFTVNFNEIQYAELKGFKNQNAAKAARNLTEIRVVRNTIYQPLNKNRKILAKLNICETHNRGPFVTLRRFPERQPRKNKKDSAKAESSTYYPKNEKDSADAKIANKGDFAEAEITHDPLKIIAEEYRKNACYQRENDSIFWKENKSNIVEICSPQLNITINSSGECGSLTIEVEISSRGILEELKLDHCNNTSEPCEETMNAEVKWISVAVGSLSIVIIVSVAATVLARRKKKAKTVKTVIEQNIVYGSEEYYEGSDLTDTNAYYDSID